MLSRDPARPNGSDPLLWPSKEPVYDLSFDFGSLSFPCEPGRLAERSRGRELISEIQSKARVLAQLEGVMERVTLDTSPFEVRKAVHEVWQSAVARASAETLTEYETLQRIRRARRDFDSPEVAPDPGFDRDAARNRVSELLEHGGVQFLDGLRHALKGIVRKNDYAHRVSEDPRILYRDILDFTGFGKKAIMDVQIRPFAVDVTVDLDLVPDDEREDILNEGAIGEHFSGADFNLSYDSSEGRHEEIFSHEQIHNLLDGLRAFRGGIPEDGYRRRLDRIVERVAAGSPEARERLRKFSARGIADACHEEILAEFPIAEPKLGRLPPGWRGIEFEDSEWSAIDHCPRMSTAGVAISEAAAAFHKAAERLADPDLSAYCDGLAGTLTEVFNDRIERLRCASFIARHLGDEAVRETRAMAVLLKPSQWRHIVPCLGEQYAKDRCEELFDLYEMLHRGALDLEGMRQILEHRDELGAEERERLSDRVRQTLLFVGQEGADNREILSALGSEDPAKLTGLRDALTELGEISDCRKETDEILALVDARTAGSEAGRERLGAWSRLKLGVARLVHRVTGSLD